MHQKLKAKPKHIAEFINYAASAYKECAGLQLRAEDIIKAADGNTNWGVDYENEMDINEEGMRTLNRVIDMHAGLIEVIWDD